MYIIYNYMNIFKTNTFDSRSNYILYIFYQYFIRKKILYSTDPHAVSDVR